MICPQCGTENAPGDKFCEQCGTPLTGAGSGAVDDAAATMVGGPPQAAVLVRSDDPGQTFPLGNRVVVGRLDTCDIPIHDKSVSREHARLSQLPGGYVVEDLGSTNGTLVNGEPITEAVILRPGDSVTFGSIDFQFQEEGAGMGDGAAADSTQPFQYRPPSQPEPATFNAQEPASPAAFAPYEAPAAQPPQFESAQGEPQAPAEEAVPAFEFPPLQPFSAAEEPVAANDQPSTTEAPEPSPPAESVPSFGTAAPVTPPEPPVTEQAHPEPEPVGQPAAVSPIPPSPVAASEPSPHAQSAPASSAMSDASPDDVIAAAAHLNNLVQALAQQAGQASAQLAESEARVRDLEVRASRADEITAALQEIPQPFADSSQLDSMRQVLDQLAEDPRDIELLMQVGRHARDLSTLLSEYVQMRQAVQRVSGAGTT